MKILMVYPEFPDTFWSFKHALRFILGIRGAERVRYWKLWLWTLFHRPRLFPQAIERAIYGYHFRRVCKLQK
jgi:hypothetical protein